MSLQLATTRMMQSNDAILVVRDSIIQVVRSRASYHDPSGMMRW